MGHRRAEGEGGVEGGAESVGGIEGGGEGGGESERARHLDSMTRRKAQPVVHQPVAARDR